MKNHKPNIPDLHVLLMKLTDGKDASQIPGLTDQTLMKVISGVGLDIEKWPTVKHLHLGLDLLQTSTSQAKALRRLEKDLKTEPDKYSGKLPEVLLTVSSTQ